MDDLNFMASQGEGPQISDTLELLRMDKIHNKLVRISIAHLTSLSTKQCDIKSSFVSSVRSLSDPNDTL